MKTLDETYDTSRDFALLLAGAPGTGKTTLALQLFPDPYIFDADNNLGGPIRVLKEKHIDKKIFYEKGNFDDDGNEVPQEKRYDRMLQLVMTALAQPEVKSIIIDSLTMVSEYLVAKLTNGGKQKMEFEHWRLYGIYLSDLVQKLRLAQKPVCITCHISCDKDEADKTFYETLAISGRMKDILSGYFSDTWLTTVEATGFGEKRKSTFVIKTMPQKDTDRRGLKSSMGFKSSTMAFDDIKLSF